MTSAVPCALRGHYTAAGRPKRPYSRKQARRLARELSARYGCKMNAYECMWCHEWHCGRAS